MNKRIRLPKEAFIDGQDVEGHGLLSPEDAPLDGPALHDEDVEGHGAGSPDDMTILPSPPSYGLSRSPGHGGELTSDDDVEGHRRR